jgi:hypothetical protein
VNLLDTRVGVSKSVKLILRGVSSCCRKPEAVPLANCGAVSCSTDTSGSRNTGGGGAAVSRT